MANYRLSHEERAALHARATEWVDKHLRNTNSPNMRLASLMECSIGPTHMACPIQGVNTLGATKWTYDSMASEFGPDAKLKDEPRPDGTEISWKLFLPILVPGGGDVSAVRRRRHLHPTNSIKPTLEWPLMLLMGEMVLCGVMWYKWTAGTIW